MNKPTILTILAIITLFVVAACGTPTPDTEETNTPTPDTTQDTTASTNQQPAATQQLSSEVSSLIEKHNELRSLTYTHAKGDTAFTVSIKGDNIRKDVTRTRYDDNRFYETIYINRDKQTATTYCTPLLDCAKETRYNVLQLDYEEENIATPFDLIESITYAEKVGAQVFNKRESTILEYTNGNNQREQLWIDQFYGVPLRHMVLEGEDETEEIISDIRFTNMAFNTLSDSDVTLPDGYTTE